MVEDYVMYILIGTSVTRIGAVLLLIFGAKVLINFYRYNLRLAAFYNSRADAIELLGDDDLKGLRQLVSSLSTEQIELDKLPDTPTDDIIKIAKTISSIRK